MADLSNRLLRGLTGLNARLPGGVRNPNPHHILVYRLGNLGDIVVSLPAFHALRLRFPAAHMTLLTSPTKRGAPGAQEVLAKDKTFDAMITYYDDESSRPNFLRSLRQRLVAKPIDLAVLLPDDRTTTKSLVKQIALLSSAGVRRIVGAEVVPTTKVSQGQVPRIMSLLEPLGCPEVESFPWIHFDDKDEARVTAMLPEYGDRPLVGLQCGAKRPANRWMPERFIALGKRLVADYQAELLLTGSAGENELLAMIAEGIGPGCTNLAGKTTIPELAALAARCRLFVSNDTGTMHVAACTGTPVVAIFSARDHAHRWYPYGEQHVVLRDNPECSPCLEDTCPLYEEPVCLTVHDVEDVLAAVERVLENR